MIETPRAVRRAAARRTAARLVGAAAAAILAVGCSAGNLSAPAATGAGTSPATSVLMSAPTAPSAPTATFAPTAAPTSSAPRATPATSPTASPARSDAPPTASLGAEGGDAVVGQLGSYTWGGTGSDSPWLPGSRLTVGAGEPLTVRIDGGGGVADWSAARVAAGTTDGTGAAALGGGEGEPIRFIGPAAGHWSVQVQVRFETGSDTAAYYWLLDVR
jgi:hypothetical protein